MFSCGSFVCLFSYFVLFSWFQLLNTNSPLILTNPRLSTSACSSMAFYNLYTFVPKVRVREFYIAMQRCPYIHEMKERLLSAPVDGEARMDSPRDPRDVRDPRDPRNPCEPPRERALELVQDSQVGTIVKVSNLITDSLANV